MKKNKGFTLIELLVVIAIIGILASVVLASLNSARNKGADAAVKSNLANARAQAEIFYDSNGNRYNGGAVNADIASNVCAPTGLAGTVNGINKIIVGAAKAAGVTNGTVGLGITSTSTNSVCVALATGLGWAATAPLKNPATAGNVYCVDSTGFSGEVAPGTVSSLDVSC